MHDHRIRTQIRGVAESAATGRLASTSDFDGNPWIAYRHPRADARLRLFCFPFAGGSARAYRDWGTDLPREIEVCPVQPPGRERRIAEPLIRRAEPLVDALVEALLPHLDLPFALFGHSLGATIAYEFAQRLRRDGHEGPRLLIVAAQRAPHMKPPGPPVYDLPEAAFRQNLRGLAGTPEALLADEELMELLGPLLRADFEINDTYRPSGSLPLNCPITAFGGRDDDGVPLHHLEAWRSMTRGRFRLQLLPGNHFTVLARRGAIMAEIATDLLPLLREL